MAGAAESTPIARATNSSEPTAGLVRDAFDATRELVRIEVALARDEFDQQAAAAKKAVMPVGAAIAAALAAFTMILVAIALATPIPWIAALILGAILLAAAATLGVVGWQSLPKRPLERTAARVETNLKQVKERIV